MTLNDSHSKPVSYIWLLFAFDRWENSVEKVKLLGIHNHTADEWQSNQHSYTVSTISTISFSWNLQWKVYHFIRYHWVLLLQEEYQGISSSPPFSVIPKLTTWHVLFFFFLCNSLIFGQVSGEVRGLKFE